MYKSEYSIYDIKAVYSSKYIDTQSVNGWWFGLVFHYPGKTPYARDCPMGTKNCKELFFDR